MVDHLVTPEAQAKGDYQIGTASITEGEHGPKQKGEVPVVRNCAVDTITRWQGKGVLDIRQVAAVQIYRRAYSLYIGGERYASMNWSPCAHIRGDLTARDFIRDRLEAKKDIKRLDEEVFSYLPRSYFDIWQNVVLFDEPLGTVGSRIGFTVRNESQIAAKVVVRLICDLIADKWRL